jgi:hypothetical protein
VKCYEILPFILQLRLFEILFCTSSIIKKDVLKIVPHLALNVEHYLLLGIRFKPTLHWLVVENAFSIFSSNFFGRCIGRCINLRALFLTETEVTCFGCIIDYEYTELCPLSDQQRFCMNLFYLSSLLINEEL